MPETQRPFKNDSHPYAKRIEEFLNQWFNSEQLGGPITIYMSSIDLEKALKDARETECNQRLQDALSKVPFRVSDSILNKHVRLWLMDLRDMVKKFEKCTSSSIVSRYQAAATPFFQAILAWPRKLDSELKRIVRDCFVALLVTSSNHRVKQVVRAINIDARSEGTAPVGPHFTRPAAPPERFASPPRGSPNPRQRSRSPSPTRGTPESKQYR